MSDQIQTNPEAVETPVTETNTVEQTAQTSPAEAPVAKKSVWNFLRNKQKRNLFVLACCLVLILIATMFGSMIQTAGWSATV